MTTEQTLETSDEGANQPWFSPLDAIVAWLVSFLTIIANLKRIRRTTRFKPDWRDSWPDLRQCEWHRDQLIAQGISQLLNDDDLKLDDTAIIRDPPASYGGPCSRTPLEMNRRFLAIARWVKDPEAIILKHAQRILKRMRADAVHGSTDAALRAAAHHELVGVSTSPIALILSRPHRGRPSKDERGYAHARAPPSFLNFAPRPTAPRKHQLPGPHPHARLTSAPVRTTYRATLEATHMKLAKPA